MAERYFILAVLTITAPLAFGVGGSRSTSDIFSGWCRMYGSMCLLMVMNVVFVKMLLSILSFHPSGIAVLPWIVMVLTVVKVAKKSDAIITRIGLNPAITGDSLGRTFPGVLTYTVARTMASRVVQTAGKNTAAGKPAHRRRPSPAASPPAADAIMVASTQSTPLPTADVPNSSPAAHLVRLSREQPVRNRQYSRRPQRQTAALSCPVHAVL